MKFPTKGIPWDTPIKLIPLKDFETIRLLGRKSSMETWDDVINQNTGLVNRYTITHKDGEPIDPNKEYLVIEISDPDPREFESALQFARFCIATGYTQLGEDIIRKLYKDYDMMTYVDLDGLLDNGPYPYEIGNKLFEEAGNAAIYVEADHKFDVEEFIKSGGFYFYD